MEIRQWPNTSTLHYSLLWAPRTHFSGSLEASLFCQTVRSVAFAPRLFHSEQSELKAPSIDPEFYYPAVLSALTMKTHHITLHYLQRRENLNFDRGNLFRNINFQLLSSEIWGCDPKSVWHISWSVWGLLGLIFSFTHQSLSLSASYSPCCG